MTTRRLTAILLALAASGLAFADTVIMKDGTKYEGEVLSEDFLPRFARQLREEFGEGARAAAEGATADFNRFRNAFVDAQREFLEKRDAAFDGD